MISQDQISYPFTSAAELAAGKWLREKGGNPMWFVQVVGHDGLITKRFSVVR